MFEIIAAILGIFIGIVVVMVVSLKPKKRSNVEG